MSLGADRFAPLDPPLRSGGGGAALARQGEVRDGGGNALSVGPLRLDALRLLATSPSAQGRIR